MGGRHRDHGLRCGDEPPARHPGRGRHPRVPRPGPSGAAGQRRSPDRPRSSARLEHRRDGRPCAARHGRPPARLRPAAGTRARRRRLRRAHDARPRAAGRRTRCRPAAATSRRPSSSRCARCVPTCSTCARPPCPRRGVGASVDATFTPLLQAVLRPASATWHGRPDLATAAATAAAARIEELRDSVRVLPPPSPYSLGTTDAPLLLTVANGLPVTMEVRLSISSTTGLRVAPIPPQRIPPLGRRQVQVSAEVVRSGQFSVEATVHSPAGRALGPPSRLQVRSTAYGTITVWLTGSAAVLLVVLAAYRVVRRIRGEPSPRDRTGPSVGPPASLGPPVPEPPTPDSRTTERDPRTAGLRRHRPGARAGAADDTGRHAARPGAPDASGTGPPPVTHPDRPRRGHVAGSGEQPHGGREPGQPRHRVPAPARARRRARPRRGQRLLHGREHPAQHRLRAAARRRADQRDGARCWSARRPRTRTAARPTPVACSPWRVRRSPLATLVAMATAPLLTRLYLGAAADRRTRSSRRPSPGCCCRRSSSTAWARCSGRC